MKREIRTVAAPAAIGPYVQGVGLGDLLFLSGQIALDPASGQMTAGGIMAETTRVLENLRAVLEAGGSDLDNVLRTTVYLADIADFPAMNEVYAQFFGTRPPARSTVGVASLPRGARVEIDAIARVRSEP